MIEYDEVKRIQEFLRQYAHLGREDRICSGCEKSDRYPVMVGWANKSPSSGGRRFLEFDFDEDDIPSLQVVATNDGDEYGGHTYTDVLREAVDYFLEHTDEPRPNDRTVKTLTIFIDQEMSYESDSLIKKDRDFPVQPPTTFEYLSACREATRRKPRDIRRWVPYI